MTASLDQRIDELLGDDKGAAGEGCPVVLEMNETLASNIVEGLRWALYGGQAPVHGRRSLLVLLDAITLAFAQHEDHPQEAV